MKILAVHADYINFEAKKQAVKAAEKIEKAREEIKECLVIFMAVEKQDEKDIGKILEKLIAEVRKIAQQVKADNLVLYPYAHLSSSLASPKTAMQVLLDAKEILKKDFTVKHAPFGWYKAFEISCKGHPLSELSRHITVEDKAKAHAKLDEPFTWQEKPNDKQKILLSSAVVLAQAIKDIHPKMQVGSIGLYQDQAYVDLANVKIKEKELDQITNRVKKLLKSNVTFEKAKDIDANLQKQIQKDLGEKAQGYQFLDTQIIPAYEDPFLESTKDINAFSCTNIASAYWKNNAANKQLVRIYCVAFSSRDELDAYNKKQKEAYERSHIKIGKELDLFFNHEISPGSPFFKPKGTIILNELEKFFREIYFNEGYVEVRTPNIYNNDLWKTSGHWDHYQEDMFFIQGEDMGVKPMNCPGHCILYKHDLKSYKDLPIRIAEFGVIHRNELSGTLHGLTRVRRFIQDDAHLFCREDQIEEEIANLIKLVQRVYGVFGLNDFKIELSTKPQKAMGAQELWDNAESSLKKAITKAGQEYTINEGDGAFYGPKIDIHIKDSYNRSHQLGTIQLDFQMPQRFELTYEGKDGKKHRPVMIHRAILGSLERFLSILIEHTNGKFPLWLSPVQVAIATITDRSDEFAKQVAKEMKEKGIRVHLDNRSESLGKKVREAQLQKTNYILTIGDKEVENKTLAIRSRDGDVKHDVPYKEFINELVGIIANRD